MDSSELQMVKRAWNQMPQGGWGKRAWRNIGATWGKRLADSYGGADKRSWQKFQVSKKYIFLFKTTLTQLNA